MTKPNKFSSKLWLIVISFVVVLGILEVVFWFYAGPILNGVIHRVVYKATDSLYRVNFEKVHIDLLHNDIYIKDFKLIPDTSLDKDQNLYRIEFDTLSLKSFRLLAFVLKHNFSLQELDVISPKVYFYSYKKKIIDTLSIDTSSPATYQIVSQDFVGASLKYLSGIKIGRIKIVNGEFGFLKKLRNTFNARRVTFTLYDFDVNRQNYKQKSLFIKDFDVSIEDYMLNLANYQRLKAKELLINSKSKTIVFVDTRLFPYKQIDSLNQFDVFAKKILLKGADFQDIYLNQKVDIDSVIIDGLSASYFNRVHNTKKQLTLRTPYQIYLLLKDRLRYVKLNYLAINKAQLYKYTANNSFAQSTIGGLTVHLYNVLIDSAAALAPDRFFFAKNFYVHIDNYSSLMRDGIHVMAARFLSIDSRKKLLIAKDFSLLPRHIKSFHNLKGKVLNTITAKELKITNFDLIKIYHSGDIQLGRVTLVNPIVKIENYGRKRKSSELYTIRGMVSNLLDKLSIQEFSILNANYNFSRFSDKSYLILRGKMDFSLTKFLLNFKRLDSKEAVNFDSFKLKFYDLSFDNSKSIHLLNVDSLILNTKNNAFIIKNLSLIPKINSDSLLREYGRSLKLKLFLPKLVISGFDVRKYWLDNDLDFKYLKISEPKIKIFSYPELSNNQQKAKLRDTIRYKAATKIVDIATQSIFDMYQAFPQIDSATYHLMKRKLAALDSLQNVAVNLVYLVNIPASQINLKDTTAKNTGQIVDIFSEIVNRLKYTRNVDSVWNYGLAKLLFIRRRMYKPILRFYELVQPLKGVIRQISTDSMMLQQADLKFIQNYNGRSFTLFNNEMSLYLYGFYLNPDSIQSCQNKLLCSDNIKLVVRNYNLRFSDSVHHLLVNRIVLNTLDSSINLKNITIWGDSTKRAVPWLLTTVIPDVQLKRVDYKKLLDSNKLYVKELDMPSGFIHFYLRQKKAGKKQQLKSNLFVLPSFLNKIRIDDLNFSKLAIHYQVKKKDIDFYTKLTANFKNFYVDSILRFRVDSLPISFWSFRLKDINFTTPKLSVSLDTLSVDCNGNIGTRKLNLTSGKSQVLLQKFDVFDINWKKLYESKYLETRKIQLISPKIYVFSQTKTKKNNSIDLKEFSLYPKIKSFLKVISLDTIELKDLKYYTLSDSLSNVSLAVYGFYLDSLVSIDSPGLFYSKNIVLEVKNFYRLVSPLYSLAFKRMNVDLAKKQVLVDSLTFHSIFDTATFMSLQKWDATLTNLYVKHFTVNLIQWDSLLFSKHLITKSIFINGLDLYTYYDDSKPHNYSKRIPHFTERLMKAPIPVDINSLILRNANIVYEEKHPNYKRPGHIELNNMNLLLTNITNNPKSQNEYLNLRLSALLENQANLSILGFLKLDTLGYPFKFYGVMGPTDLKIFNPFLIYAANLQIDSGNLSKAEFVMTGWDSLALGKFKASYKDLDIRVLAPNPDFNPKPRRFLSFVANVLVRKENPKYGIFYKTGTIAYIHDNSYSDIHFWIKALLSGVKSVVLFENKRKYKQINLLRREYLLKRKSAENLSQHR